MTARKRSRPEWEKWPRERLLDLRIRDLGLKLEGTWVEECIDALRGELKERAIALRPHCWLSDEWFSPQNVPGIGIPFYLVHPRLIRLERSMMLEAEGASRAECMRILRHEAGHAMQHGYRLHRRPSYQRLFGKSSTPYPTSYRPKPASRHFVHHLRAYYAQAHPDEDFAETFAVWLQPRSRWRKRYEGWGALRKLEYVDELMRDVAGEKPAVVTRRYSRPLNTLRQTLREHYRDKRLHYIKEDWPDFYDRDLRRLFSTDPRYRRNPTAASFLREIKPELRRMVSRWTGEYQYTIEQVLDDIIDRCQELGLRLVRSPRRTTLDAVVMLTVQTMNYLHDGHHRVAL